MQERKFVATCGYDHLLTNPDQLVYAVERNVNGVKMGIGGFNTASVQSAL